MDEWAEYRCYGRDVQRNTSVLLAQVHCSRLACYRYLYLLTLIYLSVRWFARCKYLYIILLILRCDFAALIAMEFLLNFVANSSRHVIPDSSLATLGPSNPLLSEVVCMVH